MKPLLLAAPGDEDRARALAESAGAELGRAVIRDFPDGEIYVRIDSSLEGRAVGIFCTMHPARDKLHALYFLASAARDLGAERVVLLAPYLAYLRQDARFLPGEGVTSVYAARLLSGLVDELHTIDPHLHRYRALDEIYTVPTRVIASAPRIAAWLRDRVDRPVVVGPDAESAQWAEAVARELACPALVLEKTRRGDRAVSVAPPGDPEREVLRDRRPVVVDDILSTGRTMVEALRALDGAHAGEPICLAVHAVFAAGGGYDPEEELSAAGAAETVTCDTIPHPTNRIHVIDLLAQALQ